MLSLVNQSIDLIDCILGEEDEEELCGKVILMETVVVKNPAPIKFACNTSYAILPSKVLPFLDKCFCRAQKTRGSSKMGGDSD